MITKARTFRLDDKRWAELEKAASSMGQDTSEFIREAVLNHLYGPPEGEDWGDWGAPMSGRPLDELTATPGGKGRGYS